MSRFFIPQQCIKGNIALISGPEAHHVLNVMRLKRGEKIQAFDGSGKLYQGKILDTANKKVKLQIERVLKDKQSLSLEIVLVQALPKKNKMDYIVEKCTELGIDTIIPIQSARTIVKLGQARENLRKKRWQRIAQQTAKQCGRTTIAKIRDLTPWPDVLAALKGFDLKLLFCLAEKTKRLKDVLSVQNKAKSIAIFIGPEGGFTPKEIEQACNAGCIAVSLGENTLKSDTAALAALTMVNYELN